LRASLAPHRQTRGGAYGVVPAVPRQSLRTDGFATT